MKTGSADGKLGPRDVYQAFSEILDNFDEFADGIQEELDENLEERRSYRIMRQYIKELAYEYFKTHLPEDSELVILEPKGGGLYIRLRPASYWGEL